MSPSLDKAATVLRAFTVNEPEWGSRPLAVRLGWPRSTAQFYLSGLAGAGFLRRIPGGRYRLSWQLAEFGALLTDALPWFSRARSALADLAQATRGLGFLCVLEEGRVVCIHRALGDPDAHHTAVQTDVTLPANATAAGKILYAYGRPALPSFELFTPSTITTPDEWAGELERVRADACAHSIEEWIAGHCAVGVPLWWEGEVVAAFGVQLPSSRYLARERQVVARVRQAAQPWAVPG
ncbi:IclR family transcriptional regulator [Deinococcus sp. QL22]|uniref:IclR family transcriptional regulator n=1 Tax=Deinococcus sp. QL22 TaxID=2939437 RepID=UPI00201836A8|nr:IclR family transcriptional regulator [Deinococcus sp. QL22]UQN09533.1 IclR family transcriptional regulator [Deinococcus sp. QL22]